MWGERKGCVCVFFLLFVCVFSLFFFSSPETTVIIMKTVYTDYHRLCLSTSRLCDDKIRKATRLEKPRNILKESCFFTNYLCAGFTQNLRDGSSNVWKWMNAAMQIERSALGPTPGRSSKPILSVLTRWVPVTYMCFLNWHVRTERKI